MNRADLVLLGTAALLSDGSLYSRAGTALVAMLAKESRIPVVACCETYKFGEKVMLDAVTGNELGEQIFCGVDVAATNLGCRQATPRSLHNRRLLLVR